LPPQQYLLDGMQFNMPGYCVFGIQGGIPDSAPIVLGNMFLKNYYMIYDLDNRKVGIALHMRNEGAKIV
jgi:hypothetical protein